MRFPNNKEERMPGEQAGDGLEMGDDYRFKSSAQARTILMVGNFLSRSVSTRSVCEDLAERLESSGWTVLTTSDQVGKVGRLLDMLWSIWRWRHSFAVAQVDVFSGPAFIWAESVCRLLRMLRKPYVLTLHGGNLPQFAQNSPQRVQRVFEAAALVTTPSRYLQEKMRCYRNDLELLPNPLDLGRYEFALRKQPQPRLVWLRAFHQIYNPVLAIQTLAKLVDAFPEVSLAMVGPDKKDGTLPGVLQRAKELGVTDRLTCVGGISKLDVPKALAAGDVFLNTTNVDNTPVSVLEAMACGLPVVTTNVGGIPYLARNEEEALLVPPNDPVSMTEAVRRVLTEPGLAERLSRNGRACSEKCDWSVVLPRWESILTHCSAVGRKLQLSTKSSNGVRYPFPVVRKIQVND
jgi:glycosyltransferase involved in cell wall biosynthesis